MTEKFSCEVVSWQRMYSLCRKLAHSILDSGFRPEVIVAVARGGFVPARILCDCLEVHELAGIRVVHYGAGGEKKKQARLAAPLNTGIRGRKVLLVDDLVDTGETLKVASAYLETQGPADLRTAVMQIKITTEIKPEFSARTIRKWRWVIYPWAVMEDVGAFLSRMENPPQDLDEASRRLRREYGISLPGSLLQEVFRFRRLDAETWSAPIDP